MKYTINLYIKCLKLIFNLLTLLRYYFFCKYGNSVINFKSVSFLVNKTEVITDEIIEEGQEEVKEILKEENEDNIEEVTKEKEEKEIFQ